MPPNPVRRPPGPQRRMCRSVIASLESLTATVGRAVADGSIARTITRITRADLIVVD